MPSIGDEDSAAGGRTAHIYKQKRVRIEKEQTGNVYEHEKEQAGVRCDDVCVGFGGTMHTLSGHRLHVI